MSDPELVRAEQDKQTFAGISYKIKGVLAPALILSLSENASVFFEHDVMLWKKSQISITSSSLSGGFKRMMAGLPILLVQAQGPGEIAFSR